MRHSVDSIDSNCGARRGGGQRGSGQWHVTGNATTPTKLLYHGNRQSPLPMTTRASPHVLFDNKQQHQQQQASSFGDQMYSKTFQLPYANTNFSFDYNTMSQQSEAASGHLSMTQDTLGDMSAYSNFHHSMNASNYMGAPLKYVTPHDHPYDKWRPQFFRKTPGASRPLSRLDSFGVTCAGAGRGGGGSGGAHRSPPAGPHTDPSRKLFRGQALHTVLSASDLCAETAARGASSGGGVGDEQRQYELMVSNLDYNISAREWKKILFTEFQQHIQVPLFDTLSSLKSVSILLG